MGRFIRSSLTSTHDATADAHMASSVARRQSSMRSSRYENSSSMRIPGSSSISFRQNTSSRYSSTAFEGVTGGEGIGPNSRFSRFFCGCCVTCRKPACMSPGSVMSTKSMRIIRSRLWKLLMVFFYGFVLFGSQIHQLWASVDDLAFNILSLVTFGFCILEMSLRIIAEPNYFQFGMPSFCQNKKYTIGGNDNNNTCFIGSFLFWCDLVSTCATLFAVSWINPKPFEQQTIEITLDSYGFPSEVFDNSFRLRPEAIELSLLLQIARCARWARFVRSRTVVNANNQINWYWFFKHLKWCNPLFYFKLIRIKRRQARLESLRTTGESSNFVQPSQTGDKRTSWGVLQLGILAAVRAQAEAEAKEARETQKSSVWDSLKRPLGFMRKRDDNTEIRQMAAIKIQRAWRKHVRFEAAMSAEGGSMLGDLTLDDDSNSFMNSHRSQSINPLDRVQGKRAVLAAFAQMNAHAGGKLDRREIKASYGAAQNEHAGSRFQSQAGNGRESQVGSGMRELTGQRVAVGVLLALIFSVVFTYNETSTTWPTTMVVLHNQTMNDQYRMDALYVARNTSASKMYLYKPSTMDDAINFPHEGAKELTQRERIRYVVTDSLGRESAAEFDFRDGNVEEALTEIVTTLFILFVWFFGVTAFAGPVMSLVVIPIERMVRLLGMLMVDPLGYQSTQQFKKFLIEEDKLINNTGWTREVLKGMETSFLMSTILRIGSLMKVGFGSAGVEIIRNNLQKGQSKNMLILTTQGSTVSCIFLFCDIRQFTDATECLQEEVFVFTNRIAAVVHSICHAYGGAANKNVGDAFLLSWSLEDEEANKNNGSSGKDEGLTAKSNQADKALLSVIKICIALYYDNYYLEPLSEAAKNKLKDKIKKRPGPVVQMGFGLHAGKAVQGAIGSQRKIDATYVSEAVERAEFLESSTKKYGLKLLMSGSFHRLLHPNTRRRCRKIDRVLLQDSDEDADEDDDELQGELMELFTFDMDVAAIRRTQMKTKGMDTDTISDSGSNSGEPGRKGRKMERRSHGSSRQVRNRRKSVSLRSYPALNGSEDFTLSGPGGPAGVENSQRGTPSTLGGATVVSINTQSVDEQNLPYQSLPELILPTGPALYSHNVWQSPDMKRIREKFVQGLFFQTFQAGLQAFYKKDWDLARQCFQTILENFDDGPSVYFMDQMIRNKGVPPKKFLAYGLA